MNSPRSARTCSWAIRAAGRTRLGPRDTAGRHGELHLGYFVCYARDTVTLRRRAVRHLVHGHFQSAMDAPTRDRLGRPPCNRHAGAADVMPPFKRPVPLPPPCLSFFPSGVCPCAPCCGRLPIPADETAMLDVLPEGWMTVPTYSRWETTAGVAPGSGAAHSQRGGASLVQSPR
jgi:hypothetical protein